jgi:ribosome maturation factor RimP
MTTAARIRDLIEPVLTGLDVELFDVEYGGALLKVTVDRPGGIDMDTVAIATRAISRALDEADPIPGRYTLEVSSPGLERALRTPAHFAWAVGKKVAVKSRPTFEGDRRVTGTLRAADDEGIELALDEPAGETRRLRFDDIDKARTVFEWGEAPKPGAGRSNKRSDQTTRAKKAKAS